MSPETAGLVTVITAFTAGFVGAIAVMMHRSDR
jgi:hypothetical protein